MQQRASYRQLVKENAQLKNTILSYQRSSQGMQQTIFLLAVQTKMADPENKFVTDKNFKAEFIKLVDQEIERRKTTENKAKKPE